MHFVKYAFSVLSVLFGVHYACGRTSLSRVLVCCGFTWVINWELLPCSIRRVMEKRFLEQREELKSHILHRIKSYVSSCIFDAEWHHVQKGVFSSQTQLLSDTPHYVWHTVCMAVGKAWVFESDLFQNCCMPLQKAGSDLSLVRTHVFQRLWWNRYSAFSSHSTDENSNQIMLSGEFDMKCLKAQAVMFLLLQHWC